jgi:hypothetical protein
MRWKENRRFQEPRDPASIWHHLHDSMWRFRVKAVDLGPVWINNLFKRLLHTSLSRVILCHKS